MSPTQIVHYSAVLEIPAAKFVSEAGQFEGYASTFRNTDLQGDVVMPGAFARTLQKSSGVVPILMAHNQGHVIGFGLDATEDTKGLLVKGEFALKTANGREAYELAKEADSKGVKLGLSIGYGIPQGGSEWDDKAGVRRLKDLDLYEYSIAPVPANQRARMTNVKAAIEWSMRDFEEHLRDVGFSQAAAKRIAADGFKALDQRDVDDDAERVGEAFNAELRLSLMQFQLRI